MSIRLKKKSVLQIIENLVKQVRLKKNKNSLTSPFERYQRE